MRVSNKSRGVAIALALFLGGLGAHKFYMNKPGIGILYLMFCWTFVPSLLLSLIDVIILLCMSDKEFDSKVNYIQGV